MGKKILNLFLTMVLIGIALSLSSFYFSFLFFCFSIKMFKGVVKTESVIKRRNQSYKFEEMT